MNKFYYKGMLVRQSKTKVYEYAVLREKEDGTLGVWGCSSTLDGAGKALKDALSRTRDYKYKIVALEQK